MNAVTVSWAAAAVVARERSTSGSAARYVSTANGPTPVTITSAAMEGGRTRALGARETVGEVVVVISSYNRTKVTRSSAPVICRDDTRPQKPASVEPRPDGGPAHVTARPSSSPGADDARDRAEPG